MVAHTFTCPQGLYFNSLTDGCDFRRNVDCEGKDDTEEDAETTEGTTARTTSAAASTKSGDEPETLEDVLAQIKAAGMKIRLFLGKVRKSRFFFISLKKRRWSGCV